MTAGRCCHHSVSSMNQRYWLLDHVLWNGKLLVKNQVFYKVHTLQHLLPSFCSLLALSAKYTYSYHSQHNVGVFENTVSEISEIKVNLYKFSMFLSLINNEQ